MQSLNFESLEKASFPGNKECKFALELEQRLGRSQQFSITSRNDDEDSIYSEDNDTKSANVWGKRKRKNTKKIHTEGEGEGEEGDFSPTSSKKRKRVMFSSGKKLDLSEVADTGPTTIDGVVSNYQQVNSIVSLSIGCENMDLESLSKKIPNSKYEIKKFPAVRFKICDPNVTALVFVSGRINICGARSVHNARLAAKKIIAIIKAADPLYENICFETSDFKVENLVGTFNIDKTICLESLARDIPGCTFDTDSFPGLIFHMEEPTVTLLVFKSGSVNITGAKTEEEVACAIKKFKSIAEGYIIGKNK